MKNIRSAYVFYLKLLKEFYLVFGIYYKHSFHSGNIYRCREIITKKNLTHFTWCSTPTRQNCSNDILPRNEKMIFC